MLRELSEFLPSMLKSSRKFTQQNIPDRRRRLPFFLVCQCFFGPFGTIGTGPHKRSAGISQFLQTIFAVGRLGFRCRS